MEVARDITVHGVAVAVGGDVLAVGVGALEVVGAGGEVGDDAATRTSGRRHVRRH